MPWPGTVQSEIWTANTDRVYALLQPDDPEPLYFLTSGIELTGGPFLPNSFYARANVSAASTDTEFWGGTTQGLPSDFEAAGGPFLTSDGAVLVGGGEYGSTNDDAYIYRSADYGSTWTRVAEIDGGWYFSGFDEHNDIIYAGCYNAVYFSADDGATWTLLGAVDAGYSEDTVVRAVKAISNSIIYIGVEGNDPFTDENPKVLKTENGGSVWSTDKTFPMTHVASVSNWAIYKIEHVDDTNRLWALTEDRTTGSGRVLWSKLITDGPGGWASYELPTAHPTVTGIDTGVATDCVFDSEGNLEYLAGRFNFTGYGATEYPVVWQGSSGLSFVPHICVDAWTGYTWDNTPYQIIDLREADVLAPAVYVCSDDWLLKLNSTVNNNPAPAHTYYLPTMMLKWAAWSSAGDDETFARGMVRIPEDDWS